MFFNHFIGFSLLFVLLSACTTAELSDQKKLVIGVVSYGKGSNVIERYAPLKTHLESQLKTIIEIEPAFNEVQAVQQIERKAWDVVFAPPGLAAIAISEAQYLPILPQTGGETERSVIVVQQDSPIKQLTGLANQTVALGQAGSATGYYLPIYNLYGLTLGSIRLSPTPRTTLEWIAQGEVTAGALSIAELNQYRGDFSPTKFRALSRDTHPIPAGAILMGSTVERSAQAQIRKALETAPAPVAAAAEYVTNAKPPDYSYLIEVVKRVRPIAKRIKEKPAPLY
jgi:phosphonate transport system substrate-binding protein